MKLQALFALVFTCTIQFLSAQSTALDPQKFAEELSDRNYKAHEVFNWLDSILAHEDSAKAFQFLNNLAQKGKGNYFRARFNCLLAKQISFRNVYYLYYQDRKQVDLNRKREELIRLFASAMDLAYRSEDDYLIAFVSGVYGPTISLLGDLGPAVMYTKNSTDLKEKLSIPISPGDYQFLAEMLYRVREYDECIHYAKKSVAAWQQSSNEYKPFTVSCMNTVALGYHRQRKYDSAFIYYNRALQLAKQIKDTVWTGIVSGNMGQIFYAQGKYDTAYKMLKMDYETSKEKRFYDNAANSLQWAARADLARGNKAAALTDVREAFQLLKLWPDANYLRNTYFTATQVFRDMGSYDSAFYYNNLYSSINDSLEKVVATSSLAISKAKLNDETSRYSIQNLNKQKRSQLLLRNIIIASIVVLSFFVVLIVNRQRLREKLKTEKAEKEKLRMEQQKLTMEQEVASAKVQLRMFTENLLEKTSLIEKLELQVQGKQASSEQHAIISELSRQTILTEEDWQKFKSLFEKIYPGFFINLQEKVNDITVAELRMAALTRLHLSTSQIGSILGISANSVYKTRQRLRQRLNIEPEIDIEEAIAKM